MSLRTLLLSSVLSGLLCLCKQLASVTFPLRRNARNNNTITTNPTQQAMIKLLVCLLLIWCVLAVFGVGVAFVKGVAFDVVFCIASCEVDGRSHALDPVGLNKAMSVDMVIMLL